jgi:hypothetical protein
MLALGVRPYFYFYFLSTLWDSLESHFVVYGLNFNF